MLTCIGIAAAVSDIPQLMGPEADNRRALLEGGNITLMCDNSIVGNPIPIISWLDNNENGVFDRTCICKYLGQPFSVHYSHSSHIVTPRETCPLLPCDILHVCV